jgi:hypothetical protein
MATHAPTVIVFRWYDHEARWLMDCLTLLGRDVEIVVRAATKRKGQGAVSVSFA